MSQNEITELRYFPVVGYWSNDGRVYLENDDSFYTPPLNLDEGLLESKGYLYLVADENPSPGAGASASTGILKHAAETYYSDSSTNLKESLRRAVSAANEVAFGSSRQGTTRRVRRAMVATVMRGLEVNVANVGNNRAYLISHGRAVKITNDHSWVEDLQREGTLTEDEARHHPQRDVMTRALGVAPNVVVDTFVLEAQPHDILVLCSRGLWERIEEGELAHVVSTLTPPAAAQRLAAMANTHGGSANVTALVIRISVGPAIPPSRKRQTRSLTRRLLIGALLGIGLVFMACAALFVQFQSNANSVVKPTLAGSARDTGSVSSLESSSSTATSTRVPNRSSSDTPKPTSSPISNPAATPVISIANTSPPQIPPLALPATAPRDDLIYTTMASDNLSALGYRIFSLTDPNQLAIFYVAHPEIACISSAPPAKAPAQYCIRPDAHLRLPWAELKPVNLEYAIGNSGRTMWVFLRVDDGTLAIPGLEVLRTVKGNWVLVRGRWDLDRFAIEPLDTIFVWNRDQRVYAESQISLQGPESRKPTPTREPRSSTEGVDTKEPSPDTPDSP